MRDITRVRGGGAHVCARLSACLLCVLILAAFLLIASALRPVLEIQSDVKLSIRCRLLLRWRSRFDGGCARISQAQTVSRRSKQRRWRSERAVISAFIQFRTQHTRTRTDRCEFRADECTAFISLREPKHSDNQSVVDARVILVSGLDG